MKKQSNTIQSKIKEICEALEKSFYEFLFVPHNQETRDAIIECVKTHVDTNGYELICNETNNTQEDISSGRVVINVKKPETSFSGEIVINTLLNAKI